MKKTMKKTMNEQVKSQIMKMVGRYTDGVKYNMEIIHSEDTSGLLDMPIFYGVVSSLDEQEEYYYKNINTLNDWMEFLVKSNIANEIYAVSTIK